MINQKVIWTEVMVFGVFSCPFKHRLKMLKKYTKSQEKGGSVSLYSTLMNWIWTKINTIETL